ncbi:MAG: DUF2254 domain-containing protein [Rhodobacteraceae bacterium]|nr:DUF2254 domain-containing protein [Paracoccaceae bacterium]
MKSKIGWSLLRQLRKVWVRVVIFALLAIVTVIAAQILAPIIPSGWSLKVGADAVDQVLNILASSMLAVTTFSLAIATAAFTSAAETATPRATALLQEDTTAQNVLATFLGAFLFSLVGIIALQAGYYSSNGRLILFATTGIVVAAVLIALLRWISHLVTFGRLEDTLERVEARATESLNQRLAAPYLGARPLRGDIPNSCVPLFGEDIGYVQHIDMHALDRTSQELGVKSWISALPGVFVHPARALMFSDTEILDASDQERLRSAFTIGALRDFEQDPRFALIVLSEIASRALSPAVNDPGTAIGVVGRLVRIMALWQDTGEHEIEFKSVFVPAIRPDELLDDAFRPIVRDGAAISEVQIRLQKAFVALAQVAPLFAHSAKEIAEDARKSARATLAEWELQGLEDFANDTGNAFRVEE